MLQASKNQTQSNHTIYQVSAFFGSSYSFPSLTPLAPQPYSLTLPFQMHFLSSQNHNGHRCCEGLAIVVQLVKEGLLVKLYLLYSVYRLTRDGIISAIHSTNFLVETMCSGQLRVLTAESDYLSHPENYLQQADGCISKSPAQNGKRMNLLLIMVTCF